MGVAQPQPTFSPTSTATPIVGAPLDSSLGPLYPSPANNTTLTVLEARKRLQQEAEAEFQGLGRKGSPGREFLDLPTVVQLLKLRDAGSSPEDIENRLNLKPGVVARLGRQGVFNPAAITRS
jgi:hypothetical protein